MGLASALSDRMDDAIRELCVPLPDDVAVVATGGYGQGLLAPHSDIDLLLLSNRRLTASDVRPVLMPLWDANLRVGHAMRTPRETVRLTGADVPTMAAHLTMRRLWGPLDVVDDTVRRLDKALAPRFHHLVGVLVDEERTRRGDEPYGHLAPNLKWSRGGLRSLDLVTWLRRLGLPSPVDPGRVRTARERLFELRCAFHLAAGRAHDTADAELRGPAARLLGVEPRDLVGQVVALADEVDTLVEQAVPDLGRARNPPWSPAPEADDPVLRWVVGDALEGGPVQPAPLDLGAAKQPEWTAPDREALQWLMTDARGRDGFWRLIRAGWLARMIPEWEAIRLEPHVVPFHIHAVGQHSLRTADELPSCAGWLELSSDDRAALRWAALFHDVGKGRGGDHSDEGARLVERIGTRLRWPRDLTLTVQHLVGNHLALVEMATRRDLLNPATAAEGARRFGDRRLLTLLAVLTEADSKATGTDTWTHWKATLVHQAVRGILEAMGAPRRPPGALLGTLMGLTGLSSGPIMEHLANVNDDYRSRVNPAEMARDVRLIAEGGARELRAEVVESTAGTLVVAVVAPDRRGLVAGITGVSTLCDLNILAAQLFTRTDGIACDRFVLEADDEAGRVNVLRFVAALREGAAAERDLAERVAAKAHAYRHRVRSGVDPGVMVSGGGSTWEIQLRAADRRGLLHDVTSVLAGLELDLVQVHVDTRAGVAYDTLRAVGRTGENDLVQGILAVL